MGLPYAEVIGDPIAQSKSPAIHKGWLAELGLAGDYRAVRVLPEELAAYFQARRQDADWRGCNVTIPHKETVIAYLDQLDEGAAQIGAVNCVIRSREGLTGRNTDIDGVTAALGGTRIEGEKVVLIGAGGGARAAIRYLLDQRAATVSILVRDPKKAASFRQDGPPTRVEVRSLEECAAAMAGAAAIINASPLGMARSAECPSFLLDCVADHVAGRTLFDMVYKPQETPFLATGRAHGGIPIDGLTMLIGQARTAFELFFGHAAPADERQLRGLLTT